MKPQLDLNLLYIAESLYRTLNVSKTAIELGMSQSAVSHALAKLRYHFGDPLFVRVSKGMAPTDLAKELRSSIEAFSQQGRDLAQKKESFDPKKAKGRIVIATSDMFEILLMPSLLKKIQKLAPDLQVSIRPTGPDLPKEELENGSVDIALAGFFKNVPEGFYQRKVLDVHFSTAYRKNHTTIKKPLTAKEYFEKSHALITIQGDFKDNFSRKRKFSYGTFSFTGMAWTLASSDFVLTAPTLLLEKYREYFPITIQKCPIEIPKAEIRMVWHGITHKDPIRQWFRELLKEELDIIIKI